MAVANAVECGNCAGITMDPNIPECGICGADDYLMPVSVTDCQAEDPENCKEDAHHFGIGKHVEQV